MPDRQGIIAGRYIALEFKKSEKEIKPLKGRTVLQNRILTYINKAGGYGQFIYPENFEEIYKDLKEISNGIQYRELNI